MRVLEVCSNTSPPPERLPAQGGTHASVHLFLHEDAFGGGEGDHLALPVLASKNDTPWGERKMRQDSPSWTRDTLILS